MWRITHQRSWGFHTQILIHCLRPFLFINCNITIFAVELWRNIRVKCTGFTCGDFCSKICSNFATVTCVELIIGTFGQKKCAIQFFFQGQNVLLEPVLSSSQPLVETLSPYPVSWTRKVEVNTAQSGRVLSLFSSRRNWDSPNPSPAGKCAPPPFGSGGSGTLAGERGWESPSFDEGTNTVVLNIYICVPRKCALFFHRLSILERATDHECINNGSYSKRNVGRILVQRPCEFFLWEEVFQI